MTRMLSNLLPVIGSVDIGSLTMKSNATELQALSGVGSACSSLYSLCQLALLCTQVTQS